jgi:hypothetical protein
MFWFLDENILANNERYFVEEHNPFVTSWDIDTYCNPTSQPPPEEYYVLIEEGWFKTHLLQLERLYNFVTIAFIAMNFLI